MEPVVLISIPQNEFASLVKSAVGEVLQKLQEDELQEKLLSPEKTRKLFVPEISLGTLENWSKEGLLQKHYIGKKVFYKYSEVMASLKTLKKYKTKGLAASANH